MALVRYPPQFVWRERRCYYRSPEGLLLPSVSAILSATTPVSERARLKGWRKKVGEAEAARICQASTTRGKELHKRLELYLLGAPLPPCPVALQPWRNSLQPLLKAVHDVQVVEGAVFHPELGYAGTVDAITGYGDHGWCLFDWKTANSHRQEAWLSHDKLQVVALWGAVQQTYGVTLEQAAVAIALPDQEAQLVWLAGEDLQSWWQQWVQRVQQWARMQEKG